VAIQRDPKLDDNDELKDKAPQKVAS
jgi:hypothetical protein